MKFKNKSKSLLAQQRTGGYIVIIFKCFVLLVAVVNSGFAQSYSKNGYHHSPYQSIWEDPYRRPSYQFIPSLPASGGASLIGGGRVVEAVKAHPIHYSTLGGADYDHHHTAAPPPFLSTSPNQNPSPYYSGFYYGGDKHSHSPKIRQSYPMSSAMYSSAAYHQGSIPSTVTTVSGSPPSSMYSFGRPPPKSSSFPYAKLPSRFPSQVTSASMDTYREALDLFSEVVRTLEKESVPGFGSFMSPSYAPSNGIYGSSSAAPSGFPHHLDHIMGPDFLQRAHKLYNKIIKEQNYQKGLPPPSSGYYPSPSTSASRGHPFSGFYDSQGPTKSSSSSSPYRYTKSSPYSRSMVVDKNPKNSPLERSLIDTVQAIEVNLDFPQQVDQSPSELPDEMDTSESRYLPHFNNLPPVPPPPPQYTATNFPHNQFLEIPPSPSALPPATPSPVPDEPSTLPPTPSQTPLLPMPPQTLNTIPLNENDFIEHPIPYNEYEELIKDIAINHNY